MRIQRLITFILIICFIDASGQSLNREKTIIPGNDSIKIDTLSIIPGSLTITNKKSFNIPDSLYEVNHSRSIIYFPENTADTFHVSYQTFPYNLHQHYFHRDYQNYHFGASTENNHSFRTDNTPETFSGILQTPGINKRGNISRGITIGSNQNATVNSKLNLQLSGNISDDIKIEAALSDNNIPIQPDGHTQQLQEFDQVYIKLSNQHIELLFGDYEISSPGGHFMKYNRELLGAEFNTRLYPNEENQDTLLTTGNVAISKGTYQRQKIQGKEGNQGPYRLEGSNNETSIVVLSGSEKVYIDGLLTRRGESNDYTINYNTGEITFTAKQPITKDTRIIVEFEYSQQNYAEITLTGSAEYRKKGSKFWLHTYSQSDNKNQGLQQTLTDEHKKMLSEAGDSISEAYINSYDSTGFSENEIRYLKTDSTLDGTKFSPIFIYSTNPKKAHYRVTFSYVGENKGNYKLNKNIANGRVFEWVAPREGIPQGDYAPIKKLVPPRQKQLISIGGSKKISPSTKALVEISMSNEDLNRFSKKDNEDNAGFGIHTNIQQTFLKKNNILINSKLNYDFTDRNFRPIERYKETEFERNWNIKTPLPIETGEHTGSITTTFNKKNISQNKHKIQFLSRNNKYEGIKNHFSTNTRIHDFHLKLRGSYLTSRSPQQKTYFSRYYGTISKPLWFMTLGHKQEMEDNQWKKRKNDSLLPNSSFYHQYGFYIHNKDTVNTKITLRYQHRDDFKPHNNKISFFTQANTYSLETNFQKNPRNKFSSIINYRRLSIKNDAIMKSQKPENNIVSRTNHQLKTKNNLFSVFTVYKVSSGLEIKKKYTYIKVTQGQGVYTWNDYNNNGVQELDEFETAAYQDEANYIRVLSPTQDYTKVYSNKINQTININPRNIWKEEKGIKKILSKISEKFGYTLGNQTDIARPGIFLNPFNTNMPDTNQIGQKTSIRNAIAFNKFNPKWGIDHIYNNSINTSHILEGKSQTYNKSNQLSIRYRISKRIMTSNELTSRIKKSQSEELRNKNYNIQSSMIKQKLEWTPTLKSSINGHYSYAEKKNTYSFQRLFSHKAGLQSTHSIGQGSQINLEFDYIKNKYNGEANNSVGYILLEGLQPGDNQTWRIIIQKQWESGIQLNITYEGRKSEQSNTIHNGNMEIKANF